jgi:hypothetical protein
MRRVWIAMTLAVLLSACEAQEPRGVGAVFVGPSVSAALAATIVRPFRIDGFALQCSTAGVFIAAFDVALTASAAIDLDRVTIHLLDGTNVGGPIVTIPQPMLITQFGRTHFGPGTTATLRFTPQFPCGSRLPFGLSADIFFLDVRRVSHGITLVTP